MTQNLSPSTSTRSPEEILSDAQKNSKHSSITPSFVTSLSNNEQAFARFKFHLSTLNISRSCVQYIKKNLSDRALIKIKWRFMKFDESVKCRHPLTGTKVDVDSTARYKIMMDQDFLDHIENFPVNLDLLAVDNGKELFLGANRVAFSGILHANNIKQERHIEVFNGAVDQKMEKIARMKIWAKFKCDQKFLKHLKNDSSISSQSSSLMSEDTVKVIEPEIINHDDSTGTGSSKESNLVVKPEPENKVKLTKFAELKEKVQKLHNKVELKYAMKKTNDQKQTSAKEKDLVKHLEVDSSQQLATYRSEFRIVVVKLLLYETSKVMRNPAIKKLFVEYSFLNYSGPEMETPRSLPKPDNEEPILFNFGKTFFINTEENNEDCKILASVIKNDQPIRFVVVNEPPEIPYSGMLMCEEVAFAEVSLSKLMQSTQNKYEEVCDVFDWKQKDELIGKLYLRFEGILAVERMLVKLAAEAAAKYKQHLSI